jgi:ferrous iron transport protein A
VAQNSPGARVTQRPTAVSLADLPTGTRAVVRALRGGQELMSRLSAMGFIAGAPVEVLQNRGRGPLLVRVRDTRVALGRGEAVKVLVETSS